MATSFLKSFMEAVNPAAGKSCPKEHEILKSRKGLRGKRSLRSEMASNVLLPEVTSQRVVLEEQPVGPDIIVVPQAEQVPQMDDVNVLEIPAEEVSPEGPSRNEIIVRQCISLLSLMRRVAPILILS